MFDFREERNQKATRYHAFLILACDSYETTSVCLLMQIQQYEYAPSKETTTIHARRVG